MAIIEQTDEQLEERPSREQYESWARWALESAADSDFAAAHYDCCLRVGQGPGECGHDPRWEEHWEIWTAPADLTDPLVFRDAHGRRLVAGSPEFRSRLNAALTYIGHRGSRRFRARLADAFERVAS